MTNDAAVAECPKCGAPCDTFVNMRGGDYGWGTTDLERTDYKYSATTVAELRARVERLRVQLAGCGVIAMSNTRDSLAEQMPSTSAYGWSPSLVEVHDAVFRELQNRERADAAERRVAELERVCAEAYQVVGVLLSDTDQFDTDHGEKILDNLSEARIVHEDVLPWESKEARHG